MTGVTKRYFWRNSCLGDSKQWGSVGDERGGVQVVRWPHSNWEEGRGRGGCEWEGGGESSDSKGCVMPVLSRGVWYCGGVRVRSS